LATAKFISHCLRHPDTKDWLIRHAVGATMPNLNTGILSNVPVNLPPLQTQKEIASTLDILDNRIALLRETNTTLEAIAQALFKSWFVDFDPVHAKMEGREPEGMDTETAALFPDSFEESELGLVPSGWLTTRLNKVLIARNERVNDRVVPEYSSTNHGLVPRSQLYNKLLAVSSAKNKLVHYGDIVFGLSRKVLSFGFMQDDIGSVSSAYKVYAIDKNQIEPELLARLIRTRKDYFFNAVSASSREGQSVSDESLGVLGFVCPPKYVQTALLKYIVPLLAQAILLLEQAETLSELRDTLLPRLISGQFRLPEAEALIENAE
jgi:type I restriction enzyme S subunit